MDLIKTILKFYVIIFYSILIRNSALCINVNDHLIKNKHGETITRIWAVKLSDMLHDKATDIATSLNMVNHGHIGELPSHFVFSSHTHINVNEKLKSHPAVEWYEQQELLKRTKRFPVAGKSIGPKEDHIIVPTFTDPLYPKQWHLHNEDRKDCNVTGVWAYNVTGNGVVVAIVDDGVEWQHPDLKDNYCPEGSFDLNSDDEDPTPRADSKDENAHGTRCAGEVAAAPNDVCGIGIAYRAKFSGIRILDGPMTDSIEATAFNKKMNVNDVYSCSWGPEDDGKTVDGPRFLAQAALKHGVLAGRNGFGSVFVVASGNGGKDGDNCNFDGYANSIYTVTIAAVDEFGKTPDYSEECTSMLATTVSSGGNDGYPARMITTTDWSLGHVSEQCTSSHTGTSAATPLVAGMVALMLEVRPCLMWRDVQHIMAITAVPLELDTKGKKWVHNKAGFYHSTYHGFGLLNSWRLVNAAKVWELVPWLTSIKQPLSKVNLQIPKNSPLIVSTTVTQSETENHLLNTLEHVLVTFTLEHPIRGNLKFVIICPSGTSAVIPPRHKDKTSTGFTSWTFSVLSCWGEKPYGTYKFKVIDTNKKSAQNGTLKSWKLSLYGSQMTPGDIKGRKELLKKAYSGEFISPSSNFSLPCPVGQPLLFDVTKELSERTLKLVALLSCFFMFWGVYYSIEMTFCNSEDKEAIEDSTENNTAVTNESATNYSTMDIEEG